jgi:lysophospholipase L1-like esterase
MAKLVKKVGHEQEKKTLLSLFLRVMVSIGWLVLLLIFLEILLRLLFPQLGLSREIREPHPVLHHTLTPGASGTMSSPEFKVHYRVNSMGLRDREYEIKKPGTFRILVLGDSVVEGWGVEIEESWVKKLETILNQQASGVNFEVINGGVASYSPLLYYLFLKEKGLELEPDLVIMMMDMGDPGDDYAYSKSAQFEGEVPLSCPGGYYKAKGFMRVGSKANFLFRRYSRLYLLTDYAISSLKGEATGFRPMLFDVKELPSWEAGWRLSKQYILLTRDLLKENNIPFIFTVAPPAFLVGPNEWQMGRKMLNFNLEGVDFQSFFKDFKEFAQKNNIYYLDLLNYLKSYPEHPLYYSYDIHPNSKGHKVIAEYIFLRIGESGFLGEVFK